MGKIIGPVITQQQLSTSKEFVDDLINDLVKELISSKSWSDSKLTAVNVLLFFQADDESPLILSADLENFAILNTVKVIFTSNVGTDKAKLWYSNNL